MVISAPINYAALFNGGNVGIGTNDPAFNLDVGAVKATATLTISNLPLDADGFELTDNSGTQWTYEFDNDGMNSGTNYQISLLDGQLEPLTQSRLIDATVTMINQSNKFTATRIGDTISIQQLSSGVSGNEINYLFNDTDTQITHPTHHSLNIILTDFINGANGDINFGGSLYQNGTQFKSSQWTTVEGGITFTDGNVTMSGGNVSIGDGSFLYDNATGITSIDNLSLGALTFPEDAGAVSWIDLPISGNATPGTVESYTASIGGLSILTIHGEDNGTGGLQNTGVRIENLPTSDEGQLSFLCMNGSNELVVGTNSDCSSSSLRFKDNVNALTDDSGLAEVMKLNPVSFFYKPEFNGALQANANFSGEQLGFIAEEVNQVDPRLVTLENDGTTVHGVRYEKITAVLVKAVKEIGGTISGFADHFSTKQLDTDKLCVGDTCVTQEEFLKMVQAANVTPVAKNPKIPDPVQPPQNPDPNQITPPSNGGSTPPVDVTAPVITLVGDAQVTILVGDTYTDLGATAVDDTDGDISKNIITTNLVDSTKAGTYTVTYDVSDTAHNNAVEVIRTVVVNDPVQLPQNPPTDQTGNTQ